MKLQDLCVLSPDEIGRIHQASLNILENAGVMVLSDKVLSLLANRGLEIDAASRTVKFPRQIVEECLKSVPQTFDLYDGGGNKALVIGDRIPKCAAGHNAIYVIDYLNAKRRDSTVQDVEEFAAVCHHLPSIDIVGVPLMPQDVPRESTLIHAVKALFENTTKPVFYSTEDARVNASILRIFKIITGGADLSKKPPGIGQLSPTSPLIWQKEAAEALAETAAQGVPLSILPEPMSGLSAPYTVAGLLTVSNCEALSGIALAQLINPGTPMLYGNSWTTFDMKYSSAVIGGPETSLLRIAGCQMARYYNIPSHTTAPNSDSNIHDEQNAWERAISNACSIWPGNDVIMNSGMFATGLTVSLEQLVMDDEMNSYLRRMHRGIEVNEETVAEEVIRGLGPRGNYMMEDHTFEYLYGDEFFIPSISNRRLYDNWVENGAKDIAFAAHVRASELLKKPSPRLDKEKIRAMGDVISEFEKKIKKG